MQISPTFTPENIYLETKIDIIDTSEIIKGHEFNKSNDL